MNKHARQAVPVIARNWVVKLVSGRVDAATMDAFLAWRADDRTHAAAFEEARRLYAAAGVYEVALRARPHRSHWAPRLAAGALTAGLALGLMLLRSGILFPPDYAVPDGPARQFVLADGSRMLLDGGSAVDVRMTASRRDIRLLRGRAWFQTMHAPGRTFAVTANDGTVVDIGTAFAIDATGEQTRVDVTQGSVRVEVAEERRTLHAGEMAHWSTGRFATGIGRPDALAWRDGRIVIRDQRLGDAARLLDPYIPGHIIVLGSIADARVGGVFTSHSAEQGLDALVRSQGARVARFGSFLIVTRR